MKQQSNHGVWRLLIDTAGDACTTLLCRDTDVVAQQTVPTRHTHASLLMGQVRTLLQHHHLQPHDVAAWALNGGPGSFTGLRCGMAFAAGFQAVVPTPMWRLCGLSLMAAARRQAGDEGDLFVVSDSRRSELFVAHWPRGVAVQSFADVPDIELWTPDTILKKQRVLGGQIIGYIPETIAAAVPAHVCAQSVDMTVALSWLVQQAAFNHQPTAPLLPIYARQPDISIPQQAKSERP